MKMRQTLLFICFLSIGLVLIGCSKKEESSTTASGSAGSSSAVQSGSTDVREVEPNDDYDIAQPYTIGTTVNGSFSSDDDVDFYKFTLRQPATVSVWTESNIDFYTLDINMVDSDYNLLDWISGDYTSGDEGDMRIMFVRLESGNYNIELEGFEAGSYKLYSQFE